MLTALAPRTALVSVDLQSGIVRLPVNGDSDQLTRRTGELAAVFRSHGLPVVIVTVDGAPRGKTERASAAAVRSDDFAVPVAALGDLASDIRITKRAWGAFSGTDLHLVLQDHGVTQVVVCGISTSIGVESTARTAFDLGYDVVIATDLLADTSLEAHENSLERIFPRLAELTTSAALIAAIESL